MKYGHHAILYRAESVSSFELPPSNKSVEVDSFLCERFGIDDAKELIRKANISPSQSNRQLLVVRTNFVTLEAQNALLKMLEEPPISTQFTFILPIDFVVLPTLISRFSKQDSSQVSIIPSDSEVFQTFLGNGYKERIVSIEKATKKKDTAWQRSLKQGLIEYINILPMTDVPSLKDLEYISRLLLTRGASNKMLLEHAALTLPIR
ncbi:MAG: hypothetical protein ACI9BF_000707 [Candidatus Paceibacteria bacterium]|jgi:hypothetical protein